MELEAKRAGSGLVGGDDLPVQKGRPKEGSEEPRVVEGLRQGCEGARKRMNEGSSLRVQGFFDRCPAPHLPFLLKIIFLAQWG